MKGTTSAECLELRAGAQFNPMFSIAGRLIRHWSADERQAGAYFLMVLPTLVVGLVMLQFSLWTYLETYTSGPRAAEILWTLQVIAVLAVVSTAVLGWSPRLHLRLAADTLQLQHGKRHAAVVVSELITVTLVDADRYHRDYRPYTHVHSFVVRSAPRVLVAKTPEATYGIGFRGIKQEKLTTALRNITSLQDAV